MYVVKEFYIKDIEGQWKAGQFVGSSFYHSIEDAVTAQNYIEQHQKHETATIHEIDYDKNGVILEIPLTLTQILEKIEEEMI